MNAYENYEWFLHQDLKQYSDGWVIVLDKKIVASGRDLSLLLKQVKEKYPKRTPFIAKIRNKLRLISFSV